MRWSDIIIDKQDKGQIANNAAMMGIAYEKDIEVLQQMDQDQTHNGDTQAHGQHPKTGKPTGETGSVDSFSKSS